MWPSGVILGVDSGLDERDPTGRDSVFLRICEVLWNAYLEHLEHAVVQWLGNVGRVARERDDVDLVAGEKIEGFLVSSGVVTVKLL